MKEVTKKEFYNFIGNKDAVLTVLNNYDVIFKDRKNNYKILGKSTNKENKYFLNN